MTHDEIPASKLRFIRAVSSDGRTVAEEFNMAERFAEFQNAIRDVNVTIRGSGIDRDVITKRVAV